MNDKFTNLLEKAENLRNQKDGGWNKAIKLLDVDVIPFVMGDVLAKALNTRGWALYYSAIKDFRDSEVNKIATCIEAESSLRTALENTKDRDILISVYNCLPLVLWIQGKQDEAWKISEEAISKFDEVPSVWNTVSILCRWAKLNEKSIEVCERVYQTALAIEDFRTAGHGKHNQGDAFKELGRKEEAEKAYKEAEKLYLQFEHVSGQKATVHLKGIKNKLKLLIILIAFVCIPAIGTLNGGVSRYKIISIEAPSFFI
ncbi:MAG: hypothetical protein KAI57_02920 [Candidatus Pacebacteria bacterium]|nr:hypothetical protein [Candidatus Paceibacterota bacterium]